MPEESIGGMKSTTGSDGSLCDRAGNQGFSTEGADVTAGSNGFDTSGQRRDEGGMPTPEARS